MWTHNNKELGRILKIGRSWVLVAVTAMLLPAGSARADECAHLSSLPALQTLCREPAAETFLSDISRNSAGFVERPDAMGANSGTERTAWGQNPFGARFREEPSGFEFETADTNAFPVLGARLRLRFGTLKEDPVRPYRLELPDSSYATLRGSRFKLGEHPLLPWMEIYSEFDSKERGFLSDHQPNRMGIDDRLRGSARRLRGGYFQVGYFFHEWWERVPPGLEISGRVALVEPEARLGSGLQEEWTLGANWIFPERGNRVAAGVSYIPRDYADAEESAMRFQVRWDIAF